MQRKVMDRRNRQHMRKGDGRHKGMRKGMRGNRQQGTVSAAEATKTE